MAKQRPPLPVMESITVEQVCPACDQANWLSLKDLKSAGQYRCQHCQVGIQLSSDDAQQLRDKIAHRFAELIRLG